MATPIDCSHFKHELTTCKTWAVVAASRARADLDPYYLFVCSLPDKDRKEKRVRESLMNGFYGKDPHETKPLLCDILVGETQQSQKSTQIVEENRPESQLATRVSSQSTLLTTLKHLTILRYNTPPTPTRQVDNRGYNSDDEIMLSDEESEYDSLDAVQADWL